MVICSIQLIETLRIRKSLPGFADANSKLPDSRLAVSAAMVVGQVIESDSKLCTCHISTPAHRNGSFHDTTSLGLPKGGYTWMYYVLLGPTRGRCFYDIGSGRGQTSGAAKYPLGGMSQRVRRFYGV